MENTNGVFFLLNEICDDDIQNILNKITDIKNNEISLTDPFTTEDDREVGGSDIELKEDEDDTKTRSARPKSNGSFEYDKDMVTTVENYINKTNKKSIHLKYSNAKKKYNKQYIFQDVKKFDNTDLNELTEDTYII